MIDHRTSRFARKLVLAGSLCAACACLPATAVAQSFCSEPVAPYCADKESQFDTLLQVNRCVGDLADYESQLTEYEQCVKKQIESLRQELSDARKRLENAKEDF